MATGSRETVENSSESVVSANPESETLDHRIFPEQANPMALCSEKMVNGLGNYHYCETQCEIGYTADEIKIRQMLDQMLYQVMSCLPVNLQQQQQLQMFQVAENQRQSIYAEFNRGIQQLMREKENEWIRQQADKNEQHLRTQLKAEIEQMRIDYEDRLKKKDANLANLQENLTWKSNAEECTKQMNVYIQKVEEYKKKLEQSEQMTEKLKQNYKDREEQSKEKLKHLQNSNKIIEEQNKLIQDLRYELEACKNEDKRSIEEKTEEIEKQKVQSARNLSELQAKVSKLQEENMYYKGKCDASDAYYNSVSDIIKILSKISCDKN